MKFADQSKIKKSKAATRYTLNFWESSKFFDKVRNLSFENKNKNVKS